MLQVHELAATHRLTMQSDRAWWHGRDEATPRRRFDGATRSSRYIKVADGTRLAVDVFIPDGLPEGERVPTLLSLTPYLRGMRFRRPVFEKLAEKAGLASVDWGPLFAAHGYAFMLVEIRGAGASFGRKLSIFSDELAADGSDVIDWIVAQPWSNGRVGATGISAVGLTAMFLACSKHPALRAIAPRFTVFDVYRALHPGGLLEKRFVQDIGRSLRALDSNRLHEGADNPVLRAITRLLVRGIRGVDEDLDGSLLASAVADHAKNEGFDLDIATVRFRDDPLPHSSTPATLETQSPMSLLDDINGSGVAVYAYGGWLDGAFNREMIDLFSNATTPRRRLTLGPWEHGGRHNSSPAVDGKLASEFDQAAELVRFFDLHLRDIDHGVRDEEPVHYFTMGEQRWKSAPTWPPPATMTRFNLDAGQTLTRETPAAGVDSYAVDLSATTGVWSRFGKHLAGGKGPARYPDRRKADERLLCYTSPPLDDDMEVTGHPVATLSVSTDATDGAVFAYLEDVAPDGTVRHVTEGCVRFTHRACRPDAAPYRQFGVWRTGRRADTSPAVPGEVMELTFDLYPTSWLFATGHAIRIAIAGADTDNFVVVPESSAPTLVVSRGTHASHVDLPVVAR